MKFDNVQRRFGGQGRGEWAGQGCCSGPQAARPPAGTALAGRTDAGAGECVFVCLGSRVGFRPVWPLSGRKGHVGGCASCVSRRAKCILGLEVTLLT